MQCLVNALKGHLRCCLGIIVKQAFTSLGDWLPIDFLVVGGDPKKANVYSLSHVLVRDRLHCCCVVDVSFVFKLKTFIKPSSVDCCSKRHLIKRSSTLSKPLVCMCMHLMHCRDLLLGRLLIATTVPQETNKGNAIIMCCRSFFCKNHDWKKNRGKENERDINVQ